MQRSSLGDGVAILVCALIWGTTWYAITLQFGVVDPVVSIFYRFALASAILFVWAGVRGERVTLTRAQHIAALGLGLFTFCCNYALVYWAEERITSAIVAVAFSGAALVNIVFFRFLFGERASLLTWVGAGFGAAGVALASWSELVAAEMDERAQAGLLLALLAVGRATLGNASARRGEQAGAPLVTSTAWAMASGSLLLALFALATGRAWAFDFSATYVGSLLYLSVFGSVIAFLLFFALARRRGFTLASYMGALTPPTAMAMSALFEGRHWGPLALAGLALVLAGQFLMLRGKRAAA
jgi:drug/metabolite transporter (DMT)-like permease